MESSADMGVDKTMINCVCVCVCVCVCELLTQ